MNMVVKDRERLLEAIEERLKDILEHMDAFLVDLEIRGTTEHPVIDVFIDTDAGISVEECARVNRALFARMEADNLIAGDYRLNVSSPGVDRPLRLWRQYPRQIGRKLRVVLQGEPRETIEGTLRAVHADRLELESGRSRVEVPFERIEEAHVLLPW